MGTPRSQINAQRVARMLRAPSLNARMTALSQAAKRLNAKCSRFRVAPVNARRFN
jgi:hypothetical protein